MDKNKSYYPTVVSDFILSIKGKINARSGDEVVDSYIEKLIRKTESYESQLCAYAESETAHERKNAAELLTDIAKQKQVISRVQKPEDNNTIKTVRESRKVFKIINTCRQKVENDLIALSGIYEKIVSVDADLNETIIQARKNCESKISAYNLGVRKVNSDYTPSIAYENDALEMYYSKHQKLDEEIALAVKNFKEV
ncbi:MAG: hypothetical protein K2L19_05985 [Eubacterium sp.]|nr:hypothetical protein [Eubacterium sp.]